MKLLQSIILIFSVSVSFSVSAQQIVSKQLSFKEVLEYEYALKSKNITEEEEDNGDLIIYTKTNTFYPFGASFSAPLEFSRTVSNFHITPQTAYYFDSQKKKLLFFEMSWDARLNLNIFSRSYLNDSRKVLEEENGKKSLYKSFYIKLNKSVTAIFGEPTKRLKVKEWEAYNSDGWRYEWTTDSYKVTTELRIPKEGFVDLIYINYAIAWK
jgi:hypothetical protein